MSAPSAQKPFRFNRDGVIQTATRKPRSLADTSRELEILRFSQFAGS